MQLDQLYKSFGASSGVSIDTRSLIPGQIFFAIPGERFDGHNYVDAAIDAGASLVVVQKGEALRGDKTLLVEDTVFALQELARMYRKRFEVPVVGLTGSNGKTTTKELLTAVLSKKYKVHATPGNLNNHLGVPLSILAADPESEILVIEMGANHVGEIAFLSSICDPDYGLITNIGYAHIEGFGSYEGVIQAKTELYKHLHIKNGLIFYNASDEVLSNNLPDKAKAQEYDEDLGFNLSDLSLEVKRKTDKEFSSTHLYGAYNAQNIQAAWTVGKYFEVPDTDMLSAFSEYQPKMNRSEIREVGSVTYIMDAYNANPTSMEHSIQSFKELDTQKKKVLILGDMKELGPNEGTYHAEILDFVLSHRWHQILLVGKIFSEVGNGHQEVTCFDNTEALDAFLESSKSELEDSICLMKASRSIGLERIKMLLGN